MLDRLKKYGVRTGAALERLWLSRSDQHLLKAFSEVMGCDFNVEGPDHGIPSLDPSFVPVAHVGNGDYYGLYCYPPIQGDGGDAIVQHLHEVPCLTYEADDFAVWIAKGIREYRQRTRRTRKYDPCSLLERHLGLITGNEVSSQRRDRIEPLLPTEEKIERLAGSELSGWLVESGLPPSLQRELTKWEREWVVRWVHDEADVIEEAALIDYGIEAYGRLGWQLHMETVRAAAATTETFGSTSRQERQSLLWSAAQRPSTCDARALIRALSDGEAHARIVWRRWIETYGWLAAQRASRLDDRRVLGDALVGAWEQADPPRRSTIEKLLIDFEYEEAVEVLEHRPGAAGLVAELRALRVKHADTQKELSRENDWSDL